jgi:hypothetical protein
MQDRLNCSAVHLILLRQGAPRQFRSPDFPNLIRRQFGKVLSAASGLPTLLISIRSIIGMCSEEQMIRVNAAPHVARMADTRPSQYRPAISLKRNAVNSLPLAVYLYSTVTRPVFLAALKQPTPGIRFWRDKILKPLIVIFAEVVSYPAHLRHRRL